MPYSSVEIASKILGAENPGSRIASEDSNDIGTTMQKEDAVIAREKEKVQKIYGNQPVTFSTEEEVAKEEQSDQGWQTGTVYSIIDGDGIFIKEMEGQELRAAGYDASEVEHPGEDHTEREQRNARRLAELWGVPEDSVTTEDVYEQGWKDTTKLAFELTKTNINEKLKLGDTSYYRTHPPVYNNLNIPIQYKIIDKGVYGRPIVIMKNPVTGEIVNQSFDLPGYRMGFKDAAKKAGMKTSDYVEPFLAPSPGAYGSEKKYAYKPKNWDTMTNVQRRAWNERSKKSQNYNQGAFEHAFKSFAGTAGALLAGAGDGLLDYASSISDEALGTTFGNSTLFEDFKNEDIWQRAIGYNDIEEKKNIAAVDQYIKNGDYGKAALHFVSNAKVVAPQMLGYLVPILASMPVAATVWSFDLLSDQKDAYKKATNKDMTLGEQTGALSLNYVTSYLEAIVGGKILGKGGWGVVGKQMKKLFKPFTKMVAPLENKAASKGFAEAAKLAAKKINPQTLTGRIIKRVADAPVAKLSADVVMEIIQEETENIHQEYWAKGGDTKYDSIGKYISEVAKGHVISKDQAISTAVQAGVGHLMMRPKAVAVDAARISGVPFKMVGNHFDRREAANLTREDAAALQVDRAAQEKAANAGHAGTMKTLEALDTAQTKQDLIDSGISSDILQKVKITNGEEIYQKHTDLAENAVKTTIDLVNNFSEDGKSGRDKIATDNQVRTILEASGVETKGKTKEELIDDIGVMTNEQKGRLLAIVDSQGTNKVGGSLNGIAADIKVDTAQQAAHISRAYIAQAAALRKKYVRNKKKTSNENSYFVRRRQKKVDADKLFHNLPKLINKAISKGKTNFSFMDDFSTKSLIKARQDFAGNKDVVASIDTVLKSRKTTFKERAGKADSLINEDGLVGITGEKAKDIRTINDAINQHPTDAFTIATIGDSIDSLAEAKVISKAQQKILHQRLESVSDTSSLVSKFKEEPPTYWVGQLKALKQQEIDLRKKLEELPAEEQQDSPIKKELGQTIEAKTVLKDKINAMVKQNLGAVKTRKNKVREAQKHWKKTGEQQSKQKEQKTEAELAEEAEQAELAELAEEAERAEREAAQKAQQEQKTPGKDTKAQEQENNAQNDAEPPKEQNTNEETQQNTKQNTKNTPEGDITSGAQTKQQTETSQEQETNQENIKEDTKNEKVITFGEEQDTKIDDKDNTDTSTKTKKETAEETETNEDTENDTIQTADEAAFADKQAVTEEDIKTMSEEEKSLFDKRIEVIKKFIDNLPECS